MERRILTICNDKTIFDNLQKKWLEDGMVAHMTFSFPDALKELAANHTFLLIIVFLDDQDGMSPLNIVRKMTRAPILILRKEYDSREKAAVIEAGADEYIAWTENYLIEILSSAKALIRRYTELNRTDGQDFHVLSRGSLFMSVDYRKVFINVQEITLSRKEFDLLYFLESNPGRVFTNEQLYNEVWGDDYLRAADSGLHSCLNRIRRKLDEVPGISCRIENLRGVGYRFVQDDT